MLLANHITEDFLYHCTVAAPEFLFFGCWGSTARAPEFRLGDLQKCALLPYF